MRHKREKIAYFVMICILAVLLIVLIVDSVVGGRKRREAAENAQYEVENTDNKGKLFNSDNFVVETVTINTKIIEDGLREMGLLITEEYYFTQVEEYEKTKTTLGIFSSTSTMAYSYDGVVSAGIDCNKANIEKDEENKKITITIPEAEIQYVDIDMDSFKIYEEESKMWNRLEMTDFNKSLVTFENDAKKKAVEKGIVERANENAQTIIKNFVNSIVDTNEYELVFIVE